MSDFFVYCGLAGDTDPGRFWSAGLYRSRNAEGAWESIGERLGGTAVSRSLPTAARRSSDGRNTSGIWRSDDAGDSWRRLDAPKPALGVWSLAFHPAEPTLCSPATSLSVYSAAWTAARPGPRFKSMGIPGRIRSTRNPEAGHLDRGRSRQPPRDLREPGGRRPPAQPGRRRELGERDRWALSRRRFRRHPCRCRQPQNLGPVDDRDAVRRLPERRPRRSLARLKVPQLRPIGSYCRRLATRPTTRKHFISARRTISTATAAPCSSPETTD